MTSVIKSMNMSAAARRSVEHTQTGKGKGRVNGSSKDSGNDSGDESDSSIAEVLDELKMKTIKKGAIRLKEDSFGGHKGVWARVMFGEIAVDDDDNYELEWGDAEDVQLTWSGNCNLEGQEGIACDNGYGFAGWDDTNKCYLAYNSKIEKNENCMRIIEIEVKENTKTVSSKKPVLVKPIQPTIVMSKNSTTVADRIVEIESKENTKTGYSKKSILVKPTQSTQPTLVMPLESEETKHVKQLVCSYTLTKGKSKGKACGLAVVLNGVCKKHSKNSNNSKPEHEESDDSEEPKAVQAKQPAHSVFISTQDRQELTSDEYVLCVYEFTKGKTKGQTCGKPSTTGGQHCSKHCSKHCSEKSVKKIENPNKGGDKSSDMASNNQIKNMSEAILTLLSEIFTGSLKTALADKVIDILQSDDLKTALDKVINEKIQAQATTKTSKKGGKRTKRDPAAPKRGCSSYIFFCQDKRAEVKEANPDFKGTAITVELGRMWREDVSEEDKEKYTSMAADDKERYNTAMADYTPSAEFLESKSDSDSSDSKKTKKTKKDRKPGPKKARSAYIFFCSDKRADVKAANDDMNPKDITSELGRLWREDYKDDAKKSKKWVTMAKKDKERFEKEKAEWVDPDGESYAPDGKKSSKKTESDESASDDEKSEIEPEKKTKGKKTKGKKTDVITTTKKDRKIKKADKKGAKASGFIAFTQQTRKTMRTENPEWSMQQVTDEMGKIWESMDEEEKSNY